MEENEGRITPLMNLGVQVSMRVLTIGTAMASMGLMFTNREVAYVSGIIFDADYSSSFRYLVYTYIAISAVTLFTLVWACLAVRRGRRGERLLFFFDLLATLTAISASSAAMSEAFTGKYGNTHAGWLPICRNVPGYCNRVTLSLAMSSATIILLFLLTVISASAARHF